MRGGVADNEEDSSLDDDREDSPDNENVGDADDVADTGNGDARQQKAKVVLHLLQLLLQLLLLVVVVVVDSRHRSLRVFDVGTQRSRRMAKSEEGFVVAVVAADDNENDEDIAALRVADVPNVA